MRSRRTLFAQRQMPLGVGANAFECVMSLALSVSPFTLFSTLLAVTGVPLNREQEITVSIEREGAVVPTNLAISIGNLLAADTVLKCGP